jgi:predicted dehydrogenase
MGEHPKDRPAEPADFLRAVSEGRPALSGGRLGLEVTRVVYAAYVSSEEGSRVDL